MTASEAVPGPPEEATDRGALERVAEVFVFAPVGLVLEAGRVWPQLVHRGRREVRGAQQWLERRIQSVRGETSAARRGLSRRVEPHDAPAPSSGEVSRPPVVAQPPPAQGAAPLATAPVTPRPVVGGDESRGDAVDPDELAIPDYDSLSASQVVPRLEGLGPVELELVRRYELFGRGRRTILSRIAQLQDA